MLHAPAREFPPHQAASNPAPPTRGKGAARPPGRNDDRAIYQAHPAAPNEIRLKTTTTPAHTHANSPAAHHKFHCDYTSKAPASLAESPSSAVPPPPSATVPW